MKRCWVYILSNNSNSVLYTGVTSNMVKRMEQHKSKHYKGFTAKYNCTRLIYYKEFSNILKAIAFEKKIKGGSRAKKEALINALNPERKDLSDQFV